MTEHERRRFTRIHFDANCTLSSEKGEWKVKLADICLKGALTEVDEDLPLNIGDAVNLVIELDNQDIVIEMPATLNHIMGNHFGFKAESMELSSVSHLRRLVELNIGDPELLERELDRLYQTK